MITRKFITLALIIPGFAFGQSNVFPSAGNVGIGTTSPSAKITFNNLNDGTDEADGISWYSPARLDYGIYRTAGPWIGPNYQQLKIHFETGIILNPGSNYGRSYVDIQGGGLRVSSGNVAIGSTEIPTYRLDVTGPSHDWKARFQGPDGYITIGPANPTWAHIYTDRPNFIFNQNIWSLTGGFSAYESADLTLQTNGTPRLIVKTNGHVGISTLTPTARFNIQQSSGSWNDGLRLTLMNNTWDIVADSNGDRLVIGKNQSMSQSMVIQNGNVGIGSGSPSEKLTVNGTIYGKEVKVDLSVPGPDYVFEKDYNLPSLDEIKSYIEQHKHLPEVPSAKAMEENGINVVEMNMILLKKVEELTLYIIDLKKENKETEQSLLKRIEQLEAFVKHPKAPKQK